MVLGEQEAKTRSQNELTAIRKRDHERQAQMASLEVELRQNLSTRSRLEALIEAESVERRRLQAHGDELETKLAEIADRLELKTASERDWMRRQADLEASVSRLQEEVTNASALLTIRDTDIRRSKARIDELTVVQSTLCAKLKEQTSRELSLLESHKEINQELEIAQKQIEDAESKLAALRDAAGEASRSVSAIGREHLQLIRQRLNYFPEPSSEVAEAK
jgi:chromosome segregation ATPase